MTITFIRGPLPFVYFSRDSNGVEWWKSVRLGLSKKLKSSCSPSVPSISVDLKRPVS